MMGGVPVMGAAPALAEDTASVEPASKAERATTAKSEALASWPQCMAKHEVEALLQEIPTKGKLRPPRCMHEGLLLKAKNMLEAPPQKGECQCTMATVSQALA
jgi:hypothetical protein